jgi:hypothetical protein
LIGGAARTLYMLLIRRDVHCIKSGMAAGRTEVHRRRRAVFGGVRREAHVQPREAGLVARLARARCQVGPKEASWPMHSGGNTAINKAAVGPTSGPTRRLPHLAQLQPLHGGRPLGVVGFVAGRWADEVADFRPIAQSQMSRCDSQLSHARAPGSTRLRWVESL